MTALGIGGSALAQGDEEQTTQETGQPSDATDQEGMTGTTGAMVPETSGKPMMRHEKHLAVVDFYLKNADDNAKLLEFLVAMPEAQDQAVIKEVERNLDTSLQGAQKHASKIKAAGDKELVHKIKEARTASKKLRTAKGEKQTMAVGSVATAIESARTSFDDIARSAGYQPLEERARQPVRGGSPTRDIPSPETPDMMPPASPTPPPPMPAPAPAPRPY